MMTNKTTFLEYMKKAWQDTMMPLDSSEEKKKGLFVNYFLGWPKSKKFADYLLMGGFFLLIYNMLRRPPELIFNLLSETFGYFKNKMIHSGNKVVTFLSFFPQVVQGLFKALYLLLRIITSPLISLLATAKYIDDNMENSRLKSFLMKSNIIIHGLCILGQVIGIALLGSMFSWPVLIVTGVPVGMALIDAANTPEIKFLWNNSEINTVSNITSESNNDTNTAVSEVSSEYAPPAHHTPLFTAPNELEIDSLQKASQHEARARCSL